MKRSALYSLFFLSGVAGLGYEIVWTRLLSVGLGHEIVAVLAVVAAFFAGTACGAWFLDRPVSLSRQPGRWFALFELVIGVWGLALLYMLPHLNNIVADLITGDPTSARHWTVSFVLPFFLLLPATFAMGGTLPAMDRFVGKLCNQNDSVAGVYGVNTFGAMAGTVLVTFVLLPSLGLASTSFFLAGINFVLAASLLSLQKARTARVAKVEGDIVVPQRKQHLYILLFGTGLLGIGFEILMVRVLSQLLENTVFSFASILVTYLFGTALGATVYQRYWSRGKEQNRLSAMMIATAIFCLVSICILRYLPELAARLQTSLTTGFEAAIAAEMVLSLLVLLLPAAAMGALFSHLAQSLKRHDGGVGRALCLNTLGAALAPGVFGVLLLPNLGLKITLLLIPIGYLLCQASLRRTSLAASLVVVGVIAAVSLDDFSYQFVTLDEGDTVVRHEDGVLAAVTVIKDRQDDLHLKVNNRFQMGGTGSVFSDRRQGFLPLLLHPEPRQVLFLGVGTGTTFAAAAVFPDLRAVGVELVPEVIDVMGYFEKATGDLQADKNLQIVNADARRFVTSTDQKFDVVIADLFHPARDGAGGLYTVEHFQAVYDVLNDNGLFCQWLPLYQLDLPMLQVITKTFLQVFPEGQAYLAHYSVDQPLIGLVGGKGVLKFSEDWYRKRTENDDFRRHLAGFGYDSVYSLLGTFIAGSKKLGEFVADSPVNTDMNPVVLFRAPHFVYGSHEPARDRLLRLVQTLSPPNPEAILAPEVTEEDHVARYRLPAYWAARDSFLRLGSRVERTRDVQELYETTSKPLLAVVRQSVDFSAAYFPLLSIAYDMYPYDRNASDTLLRDLERANPMRPEASVLRRKLFADQ